MTDTQLYLAPGVPILFNGGMLALTFTLIDNNFNQRLNSLEARLETLTGNVLKLSDRWARVEERLQR
jgi:hypothetical protein